MSKTPSELEAEDKAAFRRQLAALGRARGEEAIAEQVAAFGDVDRGLLEQLWHEEEARWRKRVKTAGRVSQWSGAVCLVFWSAMLIWRHVNGSKGTVNAPDIVFTLWVLSLSVCIGLGVWAEHRSPVQVGTARLILRRGPAREDCGFLVDMLKFSADKTWKEIGAAAMRELTRLLPAAVKTDTLRLDPYQRGVLREQIVLFARYLTGKKPLDISPEHADFAAAALLAVNTLGELRGDSKAHRAAHAAIQKLADAPAKPDEPLNHRYVREVARETLPLVQAGRASR